MRDVTESDIEFKHWVDLAAGQGYQQSLTRLLETFLRFDTARIFQGVISKSSKRFVI